MNLTDEQIEAMLDAAGPAPAPAGALTDEQIEAMLDAAGPVASDVGQAEEAPSNWMDDVWGAVKDYAGKAAAVGPTGLLAGALATTSDKSEAPLIGPTMAGAQGFTLGGSDEAIGALGSLLSGGFAAAQGDPADIAGRYRQYRDLARSIQGKYAEEHPLQSALYEFAGAMAGPGKLIGGITSTAAPASTLGRLATSAPGKMATFGATGAAEGAAAGYGYSDAPELSRERFTDAGIGAGMGLAFAPLSAILARGAGAALAGKPGTVEAFERQGVRPTAGMVGSPAVGWLEEGLGTIPGGAGVVRTARERSLEDIGKALQTQTGTAAPSGLVSRPIETAADAGNLIIERVDGAVNTFKANASELYRAVDDALPDGGKTQIPVQNYRNTLDSLTSVYNDNTKLGKAMLSPFIQRLKGAVGDADSLSYEQLRAIRSDIGDAAYGGQSHLIQDSSTAELRKLYSALTEDLESGVTGDAAKALSKANTYWREGRGIFDEVNWVTKADTPEAVWRKFENSGEHGVTTIDRVLRAFEGPGIPGEKVVGPQIDEAGRGLRQALGAFRMKEMGRARPGQQDASGSVMSPRTFLTEHAKYDPAARGRLFEFNDPPLQQLLDISEAERRARLSENISGTAQGAVRASTLAAPLISLATGNPMGAGVAAAGGAIGGSYIGAHMLESPVTIAALKRLAKDKKLGASSIQQSPTTRFLYEGLLQAGVDPNDEEGLDNYLRQFIR